MLSKIVKWKRPRRKTLQVSVNDRANPLMEIMIVEHDFVLGRCLLRVKDRIGIAIAGQLMPLPTSHK